LDLGIVGTLSDVPGDITCTKNRQFCFFIEKTRKNHLQQQKQKFRMMVKIHGCLMTVCFFGGGVGRGGVQSLFTTFFGSFGWVTYLRFIGLTLSFSSALDCKMGEFCALGTLNPMGPGWVWIIRVWSFHKRWVNWFQMTLYIGTSLFHQVLALDYGYVHQLPLAVFSDLETNRSCHC